VGDDACESVVVAFAGSARFARRSTRKARLATLLTSFVVALFWNDALCAEVADKWPSDAEKASYAEALAYCRGNVPRPISLRDDKRVLCFDGLIENPLIPGPLLTFTRWFLRRSQHGR